MFPPATQVQKPGIILKCGLLSTNLTETATLKKTTTLACSLTLELFLQRGLETHSLLGALLPCRQATQGVKLSSEVCLVCNRSQLREFDHLRGWRQTKDDTLILLSGPEYMVDFFWFLSSPLPTMETIWMDTTGFVFGILFFLHFSCLTNKSPSDEHFL